MNYKVSETTAVFIAAMKDFNTLYTRICNDMVEEYGSEAAEGYIEDELQAPADAFIEALEALFVKNVRATIMESPKEDII